MTAVTAVKMLYILAVAVPFVIAAPHGEVKCVWTIGAAIGTSSALCYEVFPDAGPSTWCFFSAWISMTTELVFLSDIRRSNIQVVAYVETDIRADP